MRRSYFRLLEGLLFSLPLLFASCGNGDNALEEIINGGGSGGGSSTTENKYYVWDDTQLKLVATDIPTTGIQEVTTSTTSFDGGFYIVKSDVTIPAPGIEIKADSKLILCDGAKLTINGYLEDQSAPTTYNLFIYGQEKQTGKLIIDATDSHGLWAKDIEIHGGDINITTTAVGMATSGIKTYGDLSIFGGKVVTYGGNADADATVPFGGGLGIFCGEPGQAGNLTIKGDAVVKAYGGAADAAEPGGNGIWVNGTPGNKGEIEISGNAEVYAEAGIGNGSGVIHAENNISLSAKKVEALGGSGDNGIESRLGGITISAGEVKVTAGTSGIGLKNFTADGDISITGGTVEIGGKSVAIESLHDLIITTDITSLKLTNDGITTNKLDQWICASHDVKLGSSTIGNAVWGDSSNTLADGSNTTKGGIKITRNDKSLTLVKSE